MKKTLDNVLTDMVNHARENPRHGYNCACKDEYLREARALLTEEQRDELSYLARVLDRRP